jgi:hypothetical protein
VWSFICRNAVVKDILESNTEENIWTQEGGSDQEWRKIYEELCNLYLISNIVRIITAK